MEDAFGSAPVKQKKVELVKKTENKKVTELEVHHDPAFEKTLLDLDDDILDQNADVLFNTIEETLAKDDSTSGMLINFFV